MNGLLPRTAGQDGPPGPSRSGDPVRGRLWLGTSWKMTKTLAEARAWTEAVGQAPVPPGVEVFVLPPLTALHAVREALPVGSPLLVGVQNASHAPDGALTGEVSMRQVRDAGAVLVEIGHSERREQLGETDEVVAAKVAAALREDLVPLLCVGEPASVREAGRAADHVCDQLRAALAGVAADDVPRVLVAYEPVWSIGENGRAAAPGDLVDVLERIRAVAAGLSGGRSLRGLLYGGSVTPANAEALLGLEALDGLFVGRAAWSAAGFADLLAVSGRVAARRGTPPSDRPSGRSTTSERRSR